MLVIKLDNVHVNKINLVFINMSDENGILIATAVWFYVVKKL